MAESATDKAKEFDPQVLVKHIDLFGKNLTDWEIKFISGLIDNPPVRYSRKQKEIIDRIYSQRCG